MYDGGKIIAGLVVFVALVTFPFWYSSARGSDGARPEIVLPQDATECVAPTQYMRDAHMELLDEWRDVVVRDGDRYFTGHDGIKRERSLSNTCLGCHSNKAQFCDSCHDYVGVEPYCWDCHIVPKGE